MRSFQTLEYLDILIMYYHNWYMNFALLCTKQFFYLIPYMRQIFRGSYLRVNTSRMNHFR